jgi:hypothetical protein
MSNNIVCLAVDHKYSENNGAYSIFYMWDGEKVFTEGGIYSDLAYDAYNVNASKDELLAASEHMREVTPFTNSYSKYANNMRGAYTFVGCVVKLARSRKAPNGVELLVVDFHDRYFSNAFGCWVDEKITVQDSNKTTYTVSIGCIKEVVKGAQELPFWVI